MENQKKCSNKNHANINSVIYCLVCNRYLCNKCANHHNEIFEEHQKYNLNENINEIFNGLCRQENHKIKLNYFCRNHNQLCCAACISKIKDKGNGQHTDCKVCSIEEIKNEKKNKLKENIKYLEDFSNKIESSINQLKVIFDKINEDKEKLKMKISKIFTQIRNAINQREDEILLKVDNRYNEIYFKEDIIHKTENLPNKIKKSLEKGKMCEKQWNDNNLNSLINDCINIENNIKKIKEINQNIEKYNSNNQKIKFFPEKEKEIKEFLEKIKIFGDVNIDNSFSFKFKPGKNYIVSNNGLVATKNNGGDNWNCTIIGNKEIPKNKISNWRIKINNFEIKGNTWNILIGIGPDNTNNEEDFHYKCWSFICGKSELSIKSGQGIKYNNKEKKKLKREDIIEVIVDRKLGNLSFAVNGINYGIAC